MLETRTEAVDTYEMPVTEGAFDLNAIVHPGHGPHCLLVHGALASRSYWNDNLTALQQVCQPVVVELWGHGRSPSPRNDDDYSIDGYVAAFERLRQGVGAEQWFTVGQSMGAALTLHYGLAQPERVLAQVVTNSSSAFSEPEEWIARNTDLVRPMADRVRAGGVDSLRDSWVNPSRSKRIPEPTRQALAIEFDEHDADGVARSFAITNRYLALGERLVDIAPPTMLTVGTDETRFLPLVDNARRIPGLELVDIDASHAVNAQNPEQWNAAVADFLGRHTSRTQSQAQTQTGAEPDQGVESDR